MDGLVLFSVAVIGIWGTVLLLFCIIAARETVEWWHRRRRRGAHHPAGRDARTVLEIQRRLRREAAHPARSIVVRRRTPDRRPITDHAGDEQPPGGIDG